MQVLIEFWRNMIFEVGLTESTWVLCTFAVFDFWFLNKLTLANDFIFEADSRE